MLSLDEGEGFCSSFLCHEPRWVSEGLACPSFFVWVGPADRGESVTGSHSSPRAFLPGRTYVAVLVWWGILLSSLDWPLEGQGHFPDGRTLEQYRGGRILLHFWDCLAGWTKWPRGWVKHLVMGKEHWFWGQKSWVRVSVISSKLLCFLKPQFSNLQNGNNLTGLPPAWG